MGKWVIYHQRDLELLEALDNRKGEWSTLKDIQGSSPGSDRAKLNVLIERGDVATREAKTGRGGIRYEYRITDAGKRVLGGKYAT